MFPNANWLEWLLFVLVLLALAARIVLQVRARKVVDAVMATGRNGDNLRSAWVRYWQAGVQLFKMLNYSLLGITLVLTAPTGTRDPGYISPTLAVLAWTILVNVSLSMLDGWLTVGYEADRLERRLRQQERKGESEYKGDG